MSFDLDNPWKILVAVLLLLFVLYGQAVLVEQCNQGQLGSCALLIGGR